MKKIMTLIAVLFFVAAIQAQTLQSLFDKYGNDERFEYVSVGKGMMNMASAFGGMVKNDKELISKMTGIKILTLNQNSDSPLMKSVTRDLNQIVEKGNFETAVEAREKGENVHIYYRVMGNDNADLLIVTKEKDEFSVIWISGKMSKEEMMKTFSATGEKLKSLG
ncbi:MAG: DUF4252 domain-containing protein [Paludibacter sp.]|nr:DUF4252 domain-containing protein [Paludibacter sp.]